MKRASTTMAVCIAALVLVASVSATLPGDNTHGGFVDQINSFTTNIAGVLQEEGLAGLISAGKQVALSSIDEWASTVLVTYNKKEFLQGFGLGTVFLVLEFALPQYGPVFQIFSFAPQFSFSQSYVILMSIVSKINTELLHQLEGPLTASPLLNHYFSRFETLLDIIYIPTFIILGQWYLLGVTMVDLGRNFVLLNNDPFYEYN